MYDPGYAGVSSQPVLVTPEAPPPGGSVVSRDLPSSASPASAQADAAAHITVTAPLGARVWFDGTPATSKELVRQFVSPPLKPGHRYTYDIKASWNDNGREVTQTQKVTVTAGARVQVDFPASFRAAGQASVFTDN